MTRPVSRRRWLPRLPAFRLFTAYWGSLVAVDVGRLLSLPPTAHMILVALVVAACSVRQRRLVGCAVAVIGWLFVTGFIVNDGWQLSVTGLADVGRLTALIIAAMGARPLGWDLDGSLARGAPHRPASRRSVSTTEIR